MFKKLLLTLACGLLLLPAYADLPEASCTYSGTKGANSGRYVDKLTLNDGTTNFEVDVDDTKAGTTIYFDKTSTVWEATPGTTITLTPTLGTTNYTHSYLYIDYSQEGEFDYSINSDGTPADGSELVTYNHYNGYNSASGTTGTQNAGELPQFTLPANLAAGDYRVRFKTDYNDIDPCGSTTMATNCHTMVDFTLRIAETSEATDITPIFTATNLTFGDGPIKMPSKFAEQILAGEDVTVVVDYDLPSYTTDATLFSFGHSTEHPNYFNSVTITGPGALAWRMNDDDYQYSNWQSVVITTTGTNKHLSCVMDNNNIGVYLGTTSCLKNGVTISDTQFTSVSEYTTIHLGGAEKNDNTQLYPFTGTINSIRFYGKALSETERTGLSYTDLVSDIYNLTVTAGDIDYTLAVDGNTIEDLRAVPLGEASLTVNTAVADDKVLVVTWKGTAIEPNDDGTYTFTVDGAGELAITTRDFTFSDFDTPTFGTGEYSNTDIGNCGVILSVDADVNVNNFSFGPFTEGLDQKSDEYKAIFGYVDDTKHNIIAYPGSTVELDVKIDAIWGKFALFMGTNNGNMERKILCGNYDEDAANGDDRFDGATLYIGDGWDNGKQASGELPSIEIPANAEIGSFYLVRMVFFTVYSGDNADNWTFDYNNYREGYCVDFKVIVDDQPDYDVTVAPNGATYTLKNSEGNWVLGINPDNIEESSETNETTALHNDQYTLVVHYAAEGQTVTSVTWNGETLTPATGDFTVSSVYTFTVTGDGELTINTKEVSYCIPYEGDLTYANNYVETLALDATDASWHGFALNLHPSDTHSAYLDYTKLDNGITDEDAGYLSLPANTGSTVNITLTLNGSYINRGYLFVDWNKDGDFVDNGELVSKGESENLGTTMPSFTVPTDLVDGMYRARFKVDYENEDPCTLNDVAYNVDYGTLAVDFMIWLKNTVSNLPTAVEEVENTIALYYANGAIHTNVEGEIQVYDLSGKLVRRAQHAPVAVDDLAGGVYIVRVNGNTLKFVK